jgi:hypothetical protein
LIDVLTPFFFKGVSMDTLGTLPHMREGSHEARRSHEGSFTTDMQLGDVDGDGPENTGSREVSGIIRAGAELAEPV